MELLRDRSAKFDEAGVQPFGVSRDSPWTHIAWTQALDLSFPLLSDWNGDAVHGLEIAHEFRGFKGVARRSAFLVDQSATIRGAWGYEDSEVPDLDELLAAANAL
jgi:glutaredoxin-dependent peroxiredoxin